MDLIKSKLEKLAVNLLDLISSRGFWLYVIAVLTAYKQKLEGGVTSEQFLAAVIAATVVLIVKLAAEDVSRNLGNARIAQAKVQTTGADQAQIERIMRTK